VFSHSSFAAAAAARKARVPYIIRPLGSLLPWALKRRRLTKRLLWRVGARRLLSGAVAVQCTSSTEKLHVDRLLGLPSGVVIPLGVDVSAHAMSGADNIRTRLPSALRESPYILALGRIHPVKGLELLVDAFFDVLRESPLSEWRMVFAGDGDPDYLRYLRRRIKRRSGESRVDFTGWLEGSDKTTVIRNAALLAMPSHQESFGLAAFEALSHGVPVVASSHLDLAEELRRGNAGWVTELHRESLCKTLMAAMSDNRERLARGRAGREMIRTKFTWDTTAASLAKLYRKTRVSSQGTWMQGSTDGE
jgi:glycosyltransferase involved in cell wall biosynthesis